MDRRGFLKGLFGSVVGAAVLSTGVAFGSIGAAVRPRFERDVAVVDYMNAMGDAFTRLMFFGEPADEHREFAGFVETRRSYPDAPPA